MHRILISLILLFNFLYSDTNIKNNFIIKNNCLSDIQNIRDKFVNKYYTGLVFSNNLSTARIQSNKQILKKINLLIGSTSTLIFRNEIILKNNIYLKNKTQKEFKYSINKVSLDLNLNNLNKKEFYCTSNKELLFLSMVKKEDIYKKAKTKLALISKLNKKKLSKIENEKNILKKVFLYNKIKLDYLPYLMILESSKKEKKLRDKYFKEIVYYKNKHNKFLENSKFYILIQSDENRVYDIHNKVDKIRQHIIKYLSKYSIYATSITSNELRKIIKNKNIGIININFKKIEDKFIDKESYSGSSSIYYSRLEFKLYNHINKKSNQLINTGFTYINFPVDHADWQLKLTKTVDEYHIRNNIIKKLANIVDKGYKNTKNKYFSRNFKTEIVKDNTTGLYWQDNQVNPEKNWYDAQKYCKNLSLDGYGWRLPTTQELNNILDNNKINKIFLNYSESSHWSSLSKKGNWYRNNYGNLSYFDKYVRVKVLKKDIFKLGRYVSFAYGYEYMDDKRKKYTFRCLR